jgi:hypothetical protein
MTVTHWTSYEAAQELESPFERMGGFFRKGMRWADYLMQWPEFPEYSEALREAIIIRALKQGGDWHQHDEEGVPVFSDGTAATFSYRAWGDLLAAIWSTEEDKDYGYMDFYMDARIKK